MRISLTLIFLCFSFSVFSQTKTKAEPLYYFLSKDSLIGVKNRQGKIIIPARHRPFFDVDPKEEIRGDLIYLWPVNADSTEPSGFGVAYNRKGKLLFAPFSFDNGPDYVSEGLMRYVKNGKMGFVNRIGEVVIPAQYDYVDGFRYGVASYCKGCKREYEGEHYHMKGGQWGYINYKGEELQPSIQKNSYRDMWIDTGKYLPYQFKYTLAEQKILDFFSKNSSLNKAYAVNNSLDPLMKALQYEIVERPSSFFPYYHVKAFEVMGGRYYGDELSGLNFYVSKDGKRFFYNDYFDGLTAFDKWLRKYLSDAK
jgi:hypothetical protein